MEEKNNKNKEEKNWKEFALGFAENFVKNFSLEIVGQLKEKIHEIGIKFKGNVLSMFLILLSLILLTVGVSQIVGYFFEIPGLGYLIVGFFILLAGLITKVHYSNKN